MFVVLGATGHTGSAVVETLLSRKQPVRTVVRSLEKGVGWKAKGAEVAVASLDDVSALTKAFEGAKGVYVLVPPNYGVEAWLADQRARMDRAAEAVRRSDVSHVVFLSSVGGHIAGGTGPIRAASYGEQTLETVVKNITILRPSYFMDNWAPVIGAAKAEGVLPTFIAPQSKIPMISTRDIGRIGAAASACRWTRQADRGNGRSGRLQSGSYCGRSGQDLEADCKDSARALECRCSNIQILRVFRRGGEIIRGDVQRVRKGNDHV
ncbi:MAG: NAD(P)H-binding protein [Nitrospira sp.]